MEMRGLIEEAITQLSLETQIKGFRKQLFLLAHRACQGQGDQEGPRGWVELGWDRRRHRRSWASQLCQSHAAVCQVLSEKAFI